MQFLPTGICERPGIQPPQMPQFLQELRERISEAAANIDESQLRQTWEESEYRVDVCRATNAIPIEHLEINFVSFCVVFKMFRVCVCNRFETTLIY
jgi:hypothetical protein